MFRASPVPGIEKAKCLKETGLLVSGEQTKTADVRLWESCVH
jgi:hypothetical protein